MNDRQRFTATMHYGARDRAPIMDFGFWPETIARWHEQGLPRGIDPGDAGEEASSFFGMDLFPDANAVEPALSPRFEERVIEDRGDNEVVQQADGVRVLRSKARNTIPMHQGHLLVDRASWREHYLPRLDPDHPDRYPPDREERARAWRDPQRDFPVALNGGSLYGWIRNWMGMEAISYAIHDDPAWFDEMVTACADCIIGVMERQLATGGRFDGASFWEDMCYNSGPLISPTQFKRHLVPQYRRIIDVLHRHGVDVAWVDCDGKTDELVPLWLDVGINTMFPIEIGSWGADPVAMRSKFGRDLLLMGGFDKRILAATPSAIEAEVRRLTPLVEEGGFIPFCDHRVPPDVPLSNYLFYLEAARAAWGRGIDLKPIGDLAVTTSGGGATG